MTSENMKTVCCKMKVAPCTNIIHACDLLTVIFNYFYYSLTILPYYQCY